MMMEQQHSLEILQVKGECKESYKCRSIIGTSATALSFPTAYDLCLAYERVKNVDCIYLDSVIFCYF